MFKTTTPFAMSGLEFWLLNIVYYLCFGICYLEFFIQRQLFNT